uniref:Uncharacterized protein n=1 Tax=Mus spicilegus TaxID=10103 RepID=A0A8C6MZG8_MUSSI
MVFYHCFYYEDDTVLFLFIIRFIAWTQWSFLRTVFHCVAKYVPLMASVKVFLVMFGVLSHLCSSYGFATMDLQSGSPTTSYITDNQLPLHSPVLETILYI